MGGKAGAVLKKKGNRDPRTGRKEKGGGGNAADHTVTLLWGRKNVQEPEIQQTTGGGRSPAPCFVQVRAEVQNRILNRKEAYPVNSAWYSKALQVGKKSNQGTVRLPRKEGFQSHSGGR